MITYQTEILIVGAGIVGLTIARELVESGWKDILIIEKESEVGKHASGRNSGVLHAGIYYAPDSLKAKSCLNGNLFMKQYCKEKNLPIKETGKVIVARNEAELPVLYELYKRAIANGAKVDILTDRDVVRYEPMAKTYKQALFSHYTAVVDPKKILDALKTDLEASGKVRFLFNTCFKIPSNTSIISTTGGKIQFDFFINAAGAHSDKIAHAFGIGRQYRLIPFKGIYRKLKSEKSHLFNGNIYPVPDIRNPFLGIHFTKNIHGTVYLGPTAIPAFGRENYGLVQGIDSEGVKILISDVDLFLRNAKFRNVAVTEPKKYLLPFFFKDAAQLVKELDINDLEPCEKVGIRAQLVDWHTKELVQDFMVIKNESYLHILNPVSPAFTSSMDLAKKIVKEYL